MKFGFPRMGVELLCGGCLTMICLLLGLSTQLFLLIKLQDSVAILTIDHL